MESKQSIRKIVKGKRASLTEAERKRLNDLVYENTINSEYYKKANTIFVFVSYDTEVDTHNIIKKAIEDGKTVCVPKTISMEEGMLAIRINSFDDMASGNYGILEPKYATPKVDESLIDLAFIPGLAFDKRGGRVGYGGGFYDRFMNSMREEAKQIGLAYSFQMFDEVPMEKHDLFIDGLITD